MTYKILKTTKPFRNKLPNLSCHCFSKNKNIWIYIYIMLSSFNLFTLCTLKISEIGCAGTDNVYKNGHFTFCWWMLLEIALFRFISETWRSTLCFNVYILWPYAWNLHVSLVTLDLIRLIWINLRSYFHGGGRLLVPLRALFQSRAGT